jgi:hypothetical protein
MTRSTTRQTAAFANLDDRAEKMETPYLDCRTAGHFMPYSLSTRRRVRENAKLPSEFVSKMRNTVHIESECPHCGSIKHVVRDEATGEQISSHYNYPPGYMTQAGSGRLRRADAWRVLHARLDTDL